MTMPTSTAKPSYWSTTAASLEAYSLAHWTYIVTFLVGLVIGALVF